MIRPTGISVALLWVVVSIPVSAQLVGNPVYAVKSDIGVTFAADFGRGLSAGSGGEFGLASRLVLGAPMVDFWVGGGLFDDTNAASGRGITLAGGAAISVLTAPAIPAALSFQVGAGASGCGTDCTDVSLIAGSALTIDVPTTALGMQPWIMPRIHMNRRSFGGANAIQTGFGASGGVNINLPMGLGFHAAVDLVDFKSQRTGTLSIPETSSITAGLGLHFNLTVPGLIHSK
jgi:hypothetical protein